MRWLWWAVAIALLVGGRALSGGSDPIFARYGWDPYVRELAMALVIWPIGLVAMVGLSLPVGSLWELWQQRALPRREFWAVARIQAVLSAVGVAVGAGLLWTLHPILSQPRPLVEARMELDAEALGLHVDGTVDETAARPSAAR